METHQPTEKLVTDHPALVNTLAFTSDGSTLASGDASGVIAIWDLTVRPSKLKASLSSSDSVNTLAFSPDGKILAAGNTDGTILLWDAATQEPLGQPLNGHSGLVKTLAFDSDSKILASGGYDSRIILWDVASRQPIGQPILGHTGAVFSLAFQPNKHILASGSIDNTIMIWDFEPQTWITETCQRVGRNFTQAEWNTAPNPAVVAESILGHHPDLVRADIYAAGPAAFLEALRAGALTRGLSPQGWHEERL